MAGQRALPIKLIGQITRQRMRAIVESMTTLSPGKWKMRKGSLGTVRDLWVPEKRR